MTTSPTSFLSKIARKIHQSTLHSHSNDLKDRSASHASVDVSLPSDIICPASASPLFSRTLLSLESRILTPASRLSQLASPTKEVDLSGTTLSAGKLQEIIAAVRPGLVVTLPGEKWQLSGLVIQNSVTVQGCPGTTLELSSKVTISGPQTRVVFREMTLMARDFDDCALFVVGSDGVELEVSDCYCCSSSNTAISACFYMNKDSGSGYQSKLALNGCCVMSFESAVKAGPGATIHLSRCYVSKCRDSCVLTTAPQDLSVHYCVFDQTQKSAVDVRLPADGADLDCSVSVENCEMKKCRMHGVVLRGEGSPGTVCAVTIAKNAISQCDREGVLLQSFTAREVTIQSNNLTGNRGSNLWLQHLRKSSPSASISLIENQCTESSTAYGLYIRDVSATLQRNECSRNLCNHHPVSGVLLQASGDVRIEDCTAHSNADSGLAVLDWSSGSCEVLRTGCCDNSKSGIVLVRKEARSMRRAKVAADERVGEVSVEQADLRGNREFGMRVEGVSTRVSRTVIKGNGRGAVFLDEDSIPLLIFQEEERETRQLISGTIGGSWGQLLPVKKACECCAAF